MPKIRNCVQVRESTTFLKPGELSTVWNTVLEFYFHNVISQLFRSSVLLLLIQWVSQSHYSYLSQWQREESDTYHDISKTADTFLKSQSGALSSSWKGLSEHDVSTSKMPQTTAYTIQLFLLIYSIIYCRVLAHTLLQTYDPLKAQCMYYW